MRHDKNTPPDEGRKCDLGWFSRQTPDAYGSQPALLTSAGAVALSRPPDGRQQPHSSFSPSNGVRADECPDAVDYARTGMKGSDQ